MMSKIVSAYEYVFPVIGGSLVDQDSVDKGGVIKQVYGTAFNIAGGFFLTAGHAITNGLENSFFGLGYPEKNVWKASQVVEHEVLPDYDLGIIKAIIPNARAMPWKTGEASMLQNVQSAGYPYALDLEHFRIRVRAFRGHIVSSLTFYEFRAKPRAYELSFQCPRGLSGSPVLTVSRNPSIIGVIVGNRATEMLVMSDREKTVNGSETIVERYESLQLGIALQSSSLMSLSSKTLGTTIRAYLEEAKLLD